MPNDYNSRRTSSAQRYRSVAGSSPQRGDYPRRQPARRRPPYRRRSGPPPIFILGGVLLLLVILAIVLIVIFAGKGKDGDRTKEPNSSPSSTAVSDVSGLTGAVTPTPAADPTSTPAPAVSAPEKHAEKLDALVLVGDTAYEYYNFVEEYANQYISTVSKAGENLKGTATVYDLIVPTSMDIMLPESYIEEENINSQDQKKAIEQYIFPSITAMNPDVKTVPVFDALKGHANEYIYFRTDHHWTNLGAYYGYVEFCKAKGIDAVPLDQFDKKEYPGFLGSFYSENPNTAMENNPDTVEAYVPKANTSMYVLQQDGDTLDNWPLINVGTDENYSKENKYLIFAAGDQPYEEITNHDINDGSACIVVKESFGNAFIPFLVNHYQTVYVVDYRYYTGSVTALAKEKGAKDVILVNNISMTRNSGLVEDLGAVF